MDDRIAYLNNIIDDKGETYKGPSTLFKYRPLDKFDFDMIENEYLYLCPACNLDDMKSFVEAYQSLLRQGYDILLLMTGLYENINKLQDNPSLTFLYRAPKINIGPLPLRAISSSYESLLSVSDDKALEYARITKGYAYAYQVLGSLLYETKDRELSREILNSFDIILAEHVYKKIFLSLSSKEKDIVQAIDNENIIKISELISKTNVDAKSMSQYRDKLIKRGVLISTGFGYVEFALPRFAEFLKTMY